MSSPSRQRILAAVRASQPAATPLPSVPPFDGDASVARFTTAVEGSGGQVVILPDLAQLAEVVATLYPAGYRLASSLIPATLLLDANTPVAILGSVEVAVLLGELGVAENGAIWLAEVHMLHRALPTATQHLVVVLDQRRLVATMHQAYARLTGVGGYGIFLAGPSKTADIEQSLVIGAHGARSLTVILH